MALPRSLDTMEGEKRRLVHVNYRRGEKERETQKIKKEVEIQAS